MRFLVVIAIILLSCNHRNGNVAGTHTNLSRLSKMEREDIFGRLGFDSVTVDTTFVKPVAYKRLYYDSTKTLRFFTEIFQLDTVQVYHAHFRNDSLFLLEHHTYDSSGVISYVKYYFENNKCDTIGTKNLGYSLSYYVEIAKVLYRKYRKLNK